MTPRKLALNLSLLAASTAIGVFLCELCLRLVLHPADYLGVEMVKDKILGVVPSPHSRSGGFDAWGFRNEKVPNRADMVAIGDSHTYGNTARMADSWPHTVARLTGLEVYNMGLGGYGPNQYFYLLRKALTLKPRVVICGLYVGDDFENAFLMTYGLDYWAYLRSLPDRNVDPDIWPAEHGTSWHRASRLWLSRNSLTYQLLFHGPIMGLVQGEYQIKHVSEIYPDSGTMVSIPEENILEAFLPVGILRRVNQESPAVKEGMRISFRLLKEMREICRQDGVEFLVVVIPTKEFVFSDYIEHKPIHLGGVVDKVIANERVARKILIEFFGKSAIRYIDTLPAIRASVRHELYARTGSDMHPNKNGYRVIAEAVAGFLKIGGQRQLMGNGPGSR